MSKSQTHFRKPRKSGKNHFTKIKPNPSIMAEKTKTKILSDTRNNQQLIEVEKDQLQIKGKAVDSKRVKFPLSLNGDPEVTQDKLYLFIEFFFVQIFVH